ncbi:helix-turn-helix transcriptional regulator [Duganella sp. BJB488]|uniref:XrtB/PEP-CTERM-associated transcriptional regulator EpsA n=1 Tax=unclassified Duganella TaxID=2636909 RepID=UPI000E3541D2|nr:MULTISPECIES: XrtB/PEP-CTERM-associated transcriptional regulator EpsA [unclassified Duganella]RFP12368.1 helix-turn-helix transcriptional regulator [Duganella sp. BJB489]RFP16538.1 helix-turn-helix transcriptional regulator [Duganella sp. BJB488]RFP30732.1 helix-turn-helix transcriptional regulator [Duganella sp. BJB480]
MEALVILSKVEQEYLLHAIEAVLPVRKSRQLCLWTQGQFQALLPHQIMVCLQFGAQDEVQHVECMHSTVLDAGLLARLGDKSDGLALRLARHCRDGLRLPAMLDASGAGEARLPLAPFMDELRALGLDNLLVHGTERLPGGSTFFALFGLPHRPRPRHAYFFELLLPHLHLALQRVGQQQRQARAGALARPVSAREMEILHWVREGKSNEEIGLILGISGLTVKNHLQRLYRLLGVSNRAHAIARGMALHLFEQPIPPLARAA